MKNLKNTFIFLISIVATVVFISCSREDGADGLNGKDGNNGLDGKDGNVNVSTLLIEDTNIDANQFKDFRLEALTEDMLENGLVLAYVRFDHIKQSTWFPLPHTTTNQSIKLYSLRLKNARIYAKLKVENMDLKFVIIASNTANASKNTHENILSSLKQNGIDINDYSQVTNYYNIKE